MQETPSKWVSTEAGRHLRGRRTSSTEPEVRLRSAVHRLGLRFRLHVRVARHCTPDFVLPRWGVAVFVDGCFWHGCPRHPPTFRGPNAGLWERKLAANRARDVRAVNAAQAAGWTVVRMWECEIRQDVDAAAQKVKDAAEGGAGEGQARTT